MWKAGVQAQVRPRMSHPLPRSAGRSWSSVQHKLSRDLLAVWRAGLSLSWAGIAVGTSCCSAVLGKAPWTMLLESSRQFIQVPEARRWHRLLCPANLWGPHCRGASGKQLSVGRDGQGGTPLASWDPRPPPRSCPLCVHDGHASCVPASLRSRVGALGVMVMDRGLRGPPSCFSEVPESSTVCLVPDRQH